MNHRRAKILQIGQNIEHLRQEFANPGVIIELTGRDQRVKTSPLDKLLDQKDPSALIEMKPIDIARDRRVRKIAQDRALALKELKRLPIRRLPHMQFFDDNLAAAFHIARQKRLSLPALT